MTWLGDRFVFTLWDMVRFSAEKFQNIAGSIQWMSSAEASDSCGLTGKMELRDQRQKNTREFFYRFSKELSAVGCDLSASLAHELGSSIVITKTQEEWMGKLSLFRHAVSKEMAQHLFLWVPPHRAALYDKAEETFGDEVRYRFPKALPEIKHAGESYACGLYTACVFHLMRTVEIGLKATALSLGLQLPSISSWDKILDSLSREKIEKNAEANRRMMLDLPFYQSVRQTISAIKDASRNRTMHFEGDWDERDAVEMLTAVRAFMRSVASKIDEQGTIGGPGPHPIFD